MINLRSFTNKYSKVLVALLILFSLIPIILNFIIVPDQNEVIETVNQECFTKDQIVNRFNISGELSVTEVSRDIYVVPEFSNLKCIGKVVDYVVNEEGILLYIGTNPKLTNLVFIISLFIFIFYSIFYRSINLQIINGFSFIVFLLTFTYFYLPSFNFINYFAVGFFVTAMSVYSNLRKNNFDLIEISIFVILPVFILLQFKEKWFGWMTILSLFLLIILYFIQNKIDINYRSKFLSLMIFQSFILNLGSFLKPLRDAEHWRQNQNAFSAKIIGEGGINFLNPLPVFGLNSNVPMEFPILQNLSGLLQLIGVDEHITLRPVAWIIYVLFIYFCYKFLINISNDTVAEVVTVFFIFTPIMYKFSNSYMIEFLPHLFGVLSLNLITNNKKIAILFLCLSLLSKITTGVIYLFLFACIQIFRNKEPLTRAAFMLSIAIIPNAIWNFYADYIKSKNSLTTWLTSENLYSWNFGTIDQYQSIEIYKKISSFLLSNIWGEYFTFIGIALIFYIIFKKPEAIIVLITPFIFINLYNAHEYYFLSVIPIILFYIISSLKQIISNDKIFITFCLCILVNINFGINKNFKDNYRTAYKVNENIEQAESLSLKLKTYNYENTYLSSDINDWNPIIFYEAEKKGFMYLNRFETLGDSFWDPRNIEKENIELYVFQEGNLNFDHLNIYLSHQFKYYDKIKVDFFLYRPEEGWYEDSNIFYFILSPYKSGDLGDMLISKNQEKAKVNQKLIDCFYTNEFLSFKTKYDIDLILSNIYDYQYEILNKSYTCLNESA